MLAEKSINHYKKARNLIPGGTQLLSKRPEMFLPGTWPSYYSRCKGVDVWDLDSNHYIDMTISGVGCSILGYADDDVNAAVNQAVADGNMCTLNAPQEVELAELLCTLHPWARKVRYARTGGEAMAVTARIVRAATGKDKILFCGYHGWHDWYISANLAESTALDGQLLPGLAPRGIPRGLRETAIPFQWNDLESFKQLMEQYDDHVAAVVMEPVRSIWPEDEFIKGIRDITARKNIPLVFDEITSGFRITTGGVHLRMPVNPDVAVFAKGISNGYPMAAIIGTADVMDAVQDTFISSTYWTDRIGPSAALATINKHQRCNVADHLLDIGKRIQSGWKRLGKTHDLDIHVSGIPPLSHWKIVHPQSQLIHTYVISEMLKKGFLTSKAFYASFAHTIHHVEKYMDALNDILNVVSQAVKNENVESLYTGPVAHAGFRRLT